MRFVIMIAAFITASNAIASDQGAVISEKALKCANMPTGAPSEYSISFDVTFTEKGTVKDIKVTNYEPNILEGKVTVLALSRAVQRCAPYENIKAGITKVNFTAKSSDGYINPFK